MWNSPGTLKTSLSDDIQYVKGVGPSLAKRFAKLGIHTVHDFLNTFPRSYDDRRYLPTVAGLELDEVQSCVAAITSIEEKKVKGNLSLISCRLTDASGTFVAVWFNQAFLKKTLRVGQRIFVQGKVEYNSYHRCKQLSVAEYEIIQNEQHYNESVGRIVPIYALSTGLHQRTVRQVAKEIVARYIPQMIDPMPNTMRDTFHLITLQDAYRELHHPSDLEAYTKARYRIVFDEFFYFQLALAKRKRFMKAPDRAEPLVTDGPLLRAYVDGLPYTLTGAQQRCVDQIHHDLASGLVMNRLLQGDVGAGKTEVAMLTLLTAIDSNKKGVIMAPTQILSEQHYYKFKKALEPLGVPVVLLKGRMKAKERRDMEALLNEERPMVVVGTHALIEDGIEISNLGVAVIDEQHRFGVMQRMNLKNKSQNTHCLFMTATPIPRTYMLTSFGDLDKSVMDEMPPGRTPQKTYFAKDSSLHKVYNGCRDELEKGHQLYVVYPLIEESEKLDLRSATEGYEYLKNVAYPTYNVALLHGKMPTQEKSDIMDAFKSGKINVLVSTTVIEVGVDVPNATMMIIQHAERFGLSQLHQLRGRIGRGGTDSQCYLIGDPKTPSGNKRIQAMVDTTDGFKIAEYDLYIRGPGDMLGTKQAGMPSFQLADLVKDEKILLLARQVAFDLIDKDPNLQEHVSLKNELSLRGDLFEGKQLN